MRISRALGLSAAALAAAFLFTPVPGSLLVRALFDRDARKTTAALAEGAPPVEVTRGVAYRDGDPDAKLDIYRAAKGAGPTIIWTHGGAWLSGDRTDYAGYYARLANAGFTVVSLGYSLAPGHRYPTVVRQLNDAHAFLLEHAEDCGIDPARILLAGDSAGAQLSAQLATLVTNPAYAAELGVTPALAPQQLRGVILHCGIYDVPAMSASIGLVAWGIRQALWGYTGQRNFADSPAASEMSALRWADGNFPATFISGGNADPLTDAQSKPFAARLGEQGVGVEKLFFADDHQPGLGHEYQFDLSTAAARRALEESVGFARRVTS